MNNKFKLCKKIFSLILVIALVLTTSVIVPTPNVSASNKSFGVFLGIGPENMDRLNGYKTVVIDAEYFSKSDIKKLHKKGHIVYSYINFGSLEDFRPYYSTYSAYMLKAYPNWPEEHYMDVSNTSWQNFIAGTLAKSYAKKGVDGFFVDNTDVYSEYPQKSMYKGLLRMYKKLNKTGKKIMVNGGVDFVSKALKNDNLSKYIDSVIQESVFTEYNFDTGTSSKSSKSQRKEYKKYLALCKEYGLSCYLLEYMAKGKNLKAIKKYCKKNGFTYYNSASIELE